MMVLSAVASSPGNPALTQFVLSVASGATVVLLSFMVRTMRKFMKEHEWLIKTVNFNSEAIRTLLEEGSARKSRR